jgi:UDP-N-acetylglucosamine--N-acetylmuramyl-(pentapeptide) pyrophosphoryl-undecaprenol N-acetylglucosamine transferase
MQRERLVLLAAGGTGGHLFPAQALAHVLLQRGVRVVLATDERVSEHVKDFPAEAIYEIPSATPSRKSLQDMARAAATLAKGVWVARGLIRQTIRPACVVGFGGYPSVPPVLAASLTDTPTVIHEQNAVIGRANRFLASRVSSIATGFPLAKGVDEAIRAKAVHVGNPVRAPVLEAAKTPYPPALRGGKMRVLIFGGSQGARVMSEIVPAGLIKLPEEQLRRLVITQQARPEDQIDVLATYAKKALRPEVKAFFADLPQRIADSHLVIGRSGASTVAELAVIGRPSILVPLPGALDQDQAANAAILAKIGAATVIPQTEFTPDRVAKEIAARFADLDGLTRAAEAAKSAGIADAAERLADLVMRVGRLPPKPETNA